MNYGRAWPQCQCKCLNGSADRVRNQFNDFRSRLARFALLLATQTMPSATEKLTEELRSRWPKRPCKRHLVAADATAS